MLTKLELNIIELLNKSYSFNDIQILLNLRKRTLLEVYYQLIFNKKNFFSNDIYNKLLNQYIENISFKEFQDDEIIIISDTHLGSKNENLEYLKQVKDFIEKNNIKFLLHGGDLGDGMVRYSKNYSTYPKHIDHILESYDLGTNIEQFILGGNHDLKYKRKKEEYDILNLLEDNFPNITGVGYNQAYFKIGNNIISFEHNSHYQKKNINRKLSIFGHGHCLKYKDSSIGLPTLSDSFPNIQNSSLPGFLILKCNSINDQQVLEFVNYNLTEHGLQIGKKKIYKL